MIAGKKTRELAWPTTDRFPNHGAVWPRHRFDTHLIDVAIAVGRRRALRVRGAARCSKATVCVGVDAGGESWRAPLTVLAAGAQGAAAKLLGAERDPNEPFGLAIRAYAPTPRHAERHLEACLSLRDEHGTPVPGYGWMFPAGDGTVNIGVGALSTMKGFKKLNLNTPARPVRSDRPRAVGARRLPRQAPCVAAADELRAPQRTRAGWPSATPPVSSTR